MSEAISRMLKKYRCHTLRDYENAFKEIIQEIALLGLWRANFFEKAAFYGGTALRIFYQLDRFSEDLDFSLLAPEEGVQLSKYHKSVSEELASYGFSVELKSQDKQVVSPIQSAFIKTLTKQQIFQVHIPKQLQKKLPGNRAIKIKFEVDTTPPPGFETEVKYLLNPTEFFVKTYTPESLFAGKMHALLCRKWQNRVKGRDWYDYVWYLKQDIPIDLDHLRFRMLQTQHLAESDSFNREVLIQRLNERISSLDIAAVIAEVEPFIADNSRLKIWTADFFREITKNIKIYYKN